MINRREAHTRASEKVASLIPASMKSRIEDDILRACDRGEFEIVISIVDCSPKLVEAWLTSFFYDVSVEFGVISVRWT